MFDGGVIHMHIVQQYVQQVDKLVKSSARNMILPLAL